MVWGGGTWSGERMAEELAACWGLADAHGTAVGQGAHLEHLSPTASPRPAGMPPALRFLPARAQPWRLTSPSALAGHLAVGPALLLAAEAEPLRPAGRQAGSP